MSPSATHSADASLPGESGSQVVIGTFRPEHAPAFASLNRWWLDSHEILEPADERQLNDPLGEIVAPGGHIFVALLGDEVVGTAAVVPHGPDELELAKLVVAPSNQRQGIGRLLVQACLAEAVRRGVGRVVLVSNSRLESALRLYESFGFRYEPVPASVAYATADVYMVLDPVAS